ncbi:MAG TPA: SDR family NAD(P)-dependent oxidoreductase [Anaerolineaceae bacterium]
MPDTAAVTWQNRTALVTGASAGIGAAIARRLVAGGMRVILTARRVERLNQLAADLRARGGWAEVIAADLASEAERTRLVDEVYGTGVEIDVLINNAGFGWYGYYHDMPWQTAREMLRLNVEAVIHLTALILPGMKQRKLGRVVNIGSIAGDLPNQGIAMYSGSKAFLTAYTTALHRELVGTGVSACLIKPGPVKTEFFDSADRLHNGWRVPAERYAIPAEKVADAAWQVLLHPRRMVYVPWYLGFSPWLEFLFSAVIDRLGPILLRQNAKKVRP